MENDKYFTPDIKDFHVGYKFQLSDPSFKEWINAVFDIDDPISNYNPLHWVARRIDLGKIRVPYLTKEQIEAEGWKYYQNIPDMVVPEGYVEYYKDVEWFKVVISISERSHYLTVEKVFQNVQIGDELQEFRNTIYNGECKDINTFRKICKLLGI